MCLSVPIIFTRLTGKHSSAPIGIDPMQSLKERKAVAFSPAIKESDKTIANTKLFHRYLDMMEKTKRRPVSEQFGFYEPKHQQQVSHPLSLHSNPPASTTHLYDDQGSRQDSDQETRRKRRKGHERTGRSKQRYALQRLMDMKRGDQSKLLLIFMVGHLILSLLQVITEVVS